MGGVGNETEMRTTTGNPNGRECIDEDVTDAALADAKRIGNITNSGSASNDDIGVIRHRGYDFKRKKREKDKKCFLEKSDRLLH